MTDKAVSESIDYWKQRAERAERNCARTLAQFDDALGRLQAAEADADLYRFLRRQHEADTACSFVVFAPDSDKESEATLYPVGSLPGELDSVIRAAIAQEKPNADA